jgi:hypothetical protein
MENEVGGKCGVHVKMINRCKIVEGAEEIVVDGIILHKQGVRVWIRFIWFKIESSGELLQTRQ